MIYFWHNRSELTCSLNFFYESMGASKQGFHQMVRRSKKLQEEIFLLVELIKQIRKDHPTMNCRMMYYMINPVFVGRDKFESICRECGFMVGRPKSYRKTTDSNGVVRFENLLKGFEITDIDQAWSTDITYFDVNGVFYYITFILDNHSRRILGYHVSSRLSTEHTSLPAMKMAIKTRGKALKKGVIIHSDGGGQYYDDNFLLLTKKNYFKNSMCEFAWENGKAERVNGVIKNNYLIPWGTKTPQELFKNIDRAVQLYNHEKPHSSLKRMTPVAFEEKLVNLALRNKSKMTESIDEKGLILGVKSPQSSVRNKSQNQNIISENDIKNSLKTVNVI
jgi:putative transposase